MQVETVTARPGRSLADARGEITTALKAYAAMTTSAARGAVRDLSQLRRA